MRVFTDGACSSNGRPGAKGGYAVWFPEHTHLSCSEALSDEESHTNNRAELMAIWKATRILDENGFHDDNIILYTDSSYCINCLTKYLPAWLSNGWKTTEGKDVKNKEIIKDISERLSKFKSHRFVHVRAHTGGEDDLSKQNDIVDRMARSTIDSSVKVIQSPATDDLFEGCPLRLLGPPVSQSGVVNWIREHLSSLDADVVNKHLLKAFTEICKARDVTITKQIVSKTPMLRAEKAHLQIDHVVITKQDE